MGSTDGSTSILRLSKGLVEMQPNEKRAVGAVSVFHPDSAQVFPNEGLPSLNFTMLNELIQERSITSLSLVDYCCHPLMPKVSTASTIGNMERY